MIYRTNQLRIIDEIYEIWTKGHSESWWMLWVLQSSWFWPSNSQIQAAQAIILRGLTYNWKMAKRMGCLWCFFLFLSVLYTVYWSVCRENMWTNLLPVYLCLLIMINIFWATRLYKNRIVNMMLARNIFCVTVTYLPFQTLFAFLFSHVVWIFLSGQGKCWSIAIKYPSFKLENRSAMHRVAVGSKEQQYKLLRGWSWKKSKS